MCLSPKVKIPWREGSKKEENFFGDSLSSEDPSGKAELGAMFDILITDFTCELSDSNKEHNKVNFTWQFAEATPKLNHPTTPGIFNSVYNPVYS